MKCTAAQAVAAMEYYLEYFEKATSAYASSRDKSVFALNKGSANYTYFGYFTGTQGQPWCASTVTTAIYDACGSKADAKSVMYGVYPYLVCNQVWDSAPSSKKFRRGKGIPVAGDIAVFTDDGTVRSHTGMVYYCDGTYVYTIEGNSGNQCRKRSYKLTDTYIYGFVRPDYKVSSDTVSTKVEQYGKVCCKDPELHELSKGTAGAEVRTAQALLIERGFDCGTDGADGIFGKDTKSAVKAFQKSTGLKEDGEIGANTWPKLLKKSYD